MVIDPKKSSPNKNYKNINWWLHGKNKLLFLIILCLGIIAVIGLSGFLETDKIIAINEMSDALENAQPITNDLYTSLKNYNSGATDSVTVINKLQADKTIVDLKISEMQSLNPPRELQHPYSSVLSAMQDLSMSLGLGIDGIKNDNFPEIYQAMRSKNNLTVRFNEATDEVSKLQYPAS